MSVSEFKDEPFKDRAEYQRTLFHLYPAPEFATGEVMTAALYRAIGYRASESDVTAWGKDFKGRLESEAIPYSGKITPSTWKRIISVGLASPRQPGQQRQLLPSITPLVPEACLYSNTARQQGNPWNPGNLVLSMLECGSQGSHEKVCWDSLFRALSTGDNQDPWARFVSECFKNCVHPDDKLPGWEQKPFVPIMPGIRWAEWRISGSPSEALVRALPGVLSLKPKLTRRQWISLFEALLRISCASHVAWICKANLELWEFLVNCFEEPPSQHWDGKQLFKSSDTYWPYGERIDPLIHSITRDYITGRLGVNLVLHHVSETLGMENIDLKSPTGIKNLGQAIYDGREKLDLRMVRDVHDEALERNPRLLECTHGITSNVKYFFRYTLGQRQSVAEDELNYDQGYWVKKTGPQRNASWVVSGGPVALMAMVSSCCNTHRASRTVEDFCRFLNQFGVTTRASDLAWNGLGNSMRRLGLVIDSPDAEGGMILIDPFTA
ncbi:hypothetical protein [Geomonas agri]|uniref:hypothetical protein n=1 Tax=Geomonas agri TaxID=2873702 RepID=UPI001CD36433|nr:hypothetical protein [Geomonas agri]